MSNELKAMTDGTFTFAESEDPNVFYFYRNDREVIGDVGRIPMDFYQNCGVRIDIWTHFMRECIMDYVH